MTDIAYLQPLGSLIPDNHTFPTPHMYWYVFGANAPPGFTPKAVVAPGHIFVTQISTRSSTIGGRANVMTYDLDFTICDPVTGYFINLTQFTDPRLLAAVATASCDPTSNTCNIAVDPVIELQGGDPIGVTGDPVGVHGVDMGLRDHRIATGESGFVDPSMYDQPSTAGPRSRLYAACPLDYMPSTISTPLHLLFKDPFGIVMNWKPLCGPSVYNDIAHTAMGYWFPPGYDPNDPSRPEWNVLYLGPNDYDDTMQSFSNSDAFDSSGVFPHGLYTFTPRAAPSLVDRDFASITDTQITCYDLTGPAPAHWTGRLLLQLQPAPGGDPARDHLIVEGQSGPCGPGPWALTAGSPATRVTFSR